MLSKLGWYLAIFTTLTLCEASETTIKCSRDTPSSEIITITPDLLRLNATNCHLKEIATSAFGTTSLVPLSNLKKLFLSNNDITKLYDRQFEKATKLNMIDLSHNLIADVHANAFKSLQQLKELNLGWNQIKNLQNKVFFDLQSLLYLHLNDNELQQIELFKWSVPPKLTRLYLSSNKISVILQSTFQNYPKLQRLDLSHNLLSNLHKNTFWSLRGLKFLMLSGNKLIVLDQLLFTSKIMHLFLKDCEIKTINFDIFRKNIENVHLESNRITMVKFSQPNINTLFLSLSNNSLIDFPNALIFQKLNYLDLSNNPDLQWTNKTLSGCKSLTNLHIKSAKLSSTVLESGLLNNLQQLVTLDISYNDLRTLNVNGLPDLPNLNHLSVSQTHLTEIVGYENIKRKFKSLTHIKITGNNWNCKYLEGLIEMILKLHVDLDEKDFQDNRKPNVDGIECNKIEMLAVSMTVIPVTLSSSISTSLEVETTTTESYGAASSETTVNNQDSFNITLSQTSTTSIEPTNPEYLVALSSSNSSSLIVGGTTPNLELSDVTGSEITTITDEQDFFDIMLTTVTSITENSVTLLPSINSSLLVGATTPNAELSEASNAEITTITDEQDSFDMILTTSKTKTVDCKSETKSSDQVCPMETSTELINTESSVVLSPSVSSSLLAKTTTLNAELSEASNTEISTITDDEMNSTTDDSVTETNTSSQTYLSTELKKVNTKPETTSSKSEEIRGTSTDSYVMPNSRATTEINEKYYEPSATSTIETIENQSTTNNFTSNETEEEFEPTTTATFSTQKSKIIDYEKESSLLVIRLPSATDAVSVKEEEAKSEVNLTKSSAQMKTSSHSVLPSSKTNLNTSSIYNIEKDQTEYVAVALPLIWTVVGVLVIITFVLVVLIYFVMFSNLVLLRKKSYVVRDSPQGISMGTEMLNFKDESIGDL